VNDWQSIQRTKRLVASRLRRMLRGHLWKSGYQDGRGDYTKVFVFTVKRKRGEYWTYLSDTRSIPKCHSERLAEFQGFYSGGIIDALGGGMAIYPFEEFCIEDLLCLELWMMKNWEKEVQLNLEAVKKAKTK